MCEVNDPIQWKAIPGWEDRYEACSDGRIRSLVRSNAGSPDRVLKPQKIRSGYYIVNLSRGGEHESRYVHDIITNTFFGPRPSANKYLCQVNHINGFKHDNRIENLEYVTASENIRHSRATGLRKTKFNDAQVLQIRHLSEIGQTYAQIARDFGCSDTLVAYICQFKRYEHVKAPSQTA